MFPPDEGRLCLSEVSLLSSQPFDVAKVVTKKDLARLNHVIQSTVWHSFRLEPSMKLDSNEFEYLKIIILSHRIGNIHSEIYQLRDSCLSPIFIEIERGEAS